ncbi:uncharacterized protein PRCAT00002059001 [Priceomyces carsonii]|uniref:uncharacterized protein n=1 Tax=Priceomyces carsonii TaxID=28549 RepID=UPI002ED7E6D1|nr:unnamed protein product [Priceomyces carsonii]
MDFFGISRGTIRAEALSRLAGLSVQNTPTKLLEEDGHELISSFSSLMSIASKSGTSGGKTSSVMESKEFETVIALCESTNNELKFASQSKDILEKLKFYFLDLPNQKISEGITKRLINSSPWFVLAEKISTAIIKIGMSFDSLFLNDTLEIFRCFNRNFFQGKTSYSHSHYLTLLGFLEGLNKVPNFLTVSFETFKVFTGLDSCIDNFEFYNDLEDYSNTFFKHNEYHHFIESGLEVELSPILFIETLSKLICSIMNSILDNYDEPLLEFLLKTVSKRYDDESSKGLDISLNNMELIKQLSSLAIQKMLFLDRGESYIIYSNLHRLKLGYLAKHYNLQAITCGTFTDNIDIKTSQRIFKNCLEIREVMLDPDLGLSALQMGCLLVYKDELLGAPLTRAYTSLTANPKFSYALEASKSVGLASKVLSQDAVITTIYSLTNLLFVSNDGIELHSRNTHKRNNCVKRLDSLSWKQHVNGSRNVSSQSARSGAPSAQKLIDYDDLDYKSVCENAITGIIEISQACSDETVTTLSVTILSQKAVRLDTAIGKLLLRGLTSCAPFLPEREFIILLKLLNRLSLDALAAKKKSLVESLINARADLSKKLTKDNPLYFAYLREILQSIISKGDVEELEHHRSHDEISEVATKIAIYIKPLAELLPDVQKGDEPLEIKDTTTINLFRNIWFNMVVHGYSNDSKIAQPYIKELERIAYNSPPLASELSWDRTETSLELNTVLRRGSSNHNVKHHRNIIGSIFEIHRTMSYPKLMFLSATVFVESLRVKSGDCSKILYYYSDPSVKTTGVEKYIAYIAFKIVKDYIYLISCGANKQFSADRIAEQLTNMLALCCHRLEDLQDTALQCCDLLINKIPSSLCHHKSLFALFDLLTLLFDSIIDADENQYEPTTSYRANKTGIHLLLSDSYTWRTETFNRFYEKCKNWVTLVLLKCNVDIKSLILSYVSDMDRFQSNNKIQFGVSFAIEMSGSVLANDRELSSIPKMPNKEVNTLPVFVSQLSWRTNFVNDLMDRIPLRSIDDVDKAFSEIKKKILRLKKDNKENKSADTERITDLLTEIASLTLLSDDNTASLIRYLVDIPFVIFESPIMNAAVDIWFAVMKDRPDLSVLLLSEIAKKWESSIETRVGLFSDEYDNEYPEFSKMEYAPSDHKRIIMLSHVASSAFDPHLQIIKLFASNFEASLNQSDHLLKLFTRFVEIGLANLPNASLHPFSRSGRFELIRFAFDVLNYHTKLGSRSVTSLTSLILDGTLSWFRLRASYPYGSNVLKMRADLGLLKEVARLMTHISSGKSTELEGKKSIILLFLDDEISKISVWLDSLNPQDTRGTFAKGGVSGSHIKNAYSYDPILAINLASRYKIKNLDELLQSLIAANPLPAIFYPDAVQYFIGINAGTRMPSYHLLFWALLSPIDCITLFLPPFESNPYVLQYTMRSLESHDVNLVFFYVPQIVQSLRFDVKGNVERFIIETAKVSQLFAHQIIWNMMANSYKDEDSTEPDSLKPTLDRIQAKMIKSFSREDYDFYEKEFGFFNEVTSISGKLKPYIKKTKAEKKIKIDQEMADIQVLPDVYLPSNPDGVVIDINRKSGKPLQSHAKAPFMATFKIKKEVQEIDDHGKTSTTSIEKWQSAIFKVGDDCRQDVLALQLISVFRTIWTSAGLDLYVFPYRVTATAPGCGVIDVLPNSISRDMLGREAVNGLYEYFTTKFGPENSIEFQRARNNLIKSLAAYSIISYLLQFKDRHNGNIMYDDQGHILHIDFGFCFDIVPGGVKFEVAPFKLTHEMIMVLGGSNNTQAFRWFEELCVKGYLACRPYMETIVRCVTPMLESGLPCFKESTIKKLRSRFVPSKSDKEASHFMRGLIRKSMESVYTKGYDEFQKLTNGIPC